MVQQGNQGVGIRAQDTYFLLILPFNLQGLPVLPGEQAQAAICGKRGERLAQERQSDQEKDNSNPCE